jgi:hypothetical protein
MTSLNKKLLASATVLLFATGCGSGMSAMNSGDNSKLSSPEFQNLKVSGAVKEGKYEDRKLVYLDTANQMLVVQLPTLALPAMVGNLGQTISVPQLPGTSLNLEVSSDGNLTLVARIPLAQVMQGASFIPAQRLPNGDPLPAIPDGELPGLAVDLNSQGSVKGYLYLGKGTVGAFVTTPFNPTVAMQLPIYQGNGSTLGYLTTVPDKNSSPGGIFMSVKLPADVARIIDDAL